MAKFRVFDEEDWILMPGAIHFSNGLEPLIAAERGVATVIDRHSIQTIVFSNGEISRVEASEATMLLLRNNALVLANMEFDAVCECDHTQFSHFNPITSTVESCQYETCDCPIFRDRDQEMR